MWKRRKSARPYATVDRHGHRICARPPRSPDRRCRRPRNAWRRCVGDQSIRHLPRRWLFRSARPAGQPAACSIAVHILHRGKNAVCDPADWPWRCDQPCDGDFERRAAKRRTHHRVSFAHEPVSAWAPAEHFHLRLIRSRPIGRARARTRRPRELIPFNFSETCAADAAVRERIMSFSRCFDTLSALKWMTAAVRAITALGNPRIPAREHRPMLPLAALLMAAVLVPAPGRSQEPSAPTAESNEAPKPDAEPSAPSPAEASPPAEQAPAAVGVPEVVVSAPRPKRATTAPPAPTTPPPGA